MLTAEIVFGVAVVVSTLAAAASARRDRQATDRALNKACVIYADLVEQQRRARAEAAPVLLPFPVPKPRVYDVTRTTPPPPRPGAV